jgi:hypothetical protein
MLAARRHHEVVVLSRGEGLMSGRINGQVSTSAIRSERSAWRKSSHSAGDGACVEVAVSSDFVYVRDSKARIGGTLSFGLATWAAFIDAVQRGDFR